MAELESKSTNASDCAILKANQIKSEAKRLGFSYCGLAPAEPVTEKVCQYYREWLAEERQADMHYLENYLDKRFDPRLLVPGVKTIVSLAFNYFPKKTAKGIAWYAQGQDYHNLLHQKLSLLLDTLGVGGRCFVDTAPVLEKYWAWRCGLGWIGRHTQLVVPHAGSTFFLGELFLCSEVDAYDTPLSPTPFGNDVGGLCGTCRRCLDACPTQAICQRQTKGAIQTSAGCSIDAHKCLSYLTIENRGEVPDWAKPFLEETFYGCDRCIKACPHMRSAVPSAEPLLEPKQELLDMQAQDWVQLTREQYQSLFKGSAVKRAKYEGLMRNIKASKGS